RHLELVLEVGHRAHTAHDAVRALPRHEIDEQAVERHDAKALETDGRLVDHLEPFGDREERRLPGVRHDSDDQLVEDPETALDQVDVTVVHGIEHAGIDRALAHSHSPRSGTPDRTRAAEAKSSTRA